MKNKLLKTVGIFLLLVPFRLTISILLIKLFTFTATVNGEDVPLKIVSASVLISKSCYDLALGIWLAIMLGNIYYSLAKTDELDYYGKTKVDEWYVFAIISFPFIGSSISVILLFIHLALSISSICYVLAFVNNIFL